MGTTMYDANFFDRYRYWHKYNKRPGAPNLTTNNAIRARYNATFVGPPGQNAPPTTTVAHPVATRPIRRGRPIWKPRNMPLKDKLPWSHGGLYKGVTYQPFTAPQGGAPNWRAAKILGIGGGGAVVLWEYVGPLVIPPPVITKIVVKNKKNPDINWLAAEGVFMQQLTASPTEHIGTSGGRPRLTAAWDGITRQLVMEYCPQGPLCRLIEERARRWVLCTFMHGDSFVAYISPSLGPHTDIFLAFRCLPLHELTIWHIFECIVDALSVLEYGAELIPNPAAPGSFMPNPAFAPALGPGMMVVHFDLKPENIFGTEPTAQGGSHPHTQTWKLGDFGLARNIHRVGYNMPLPAGTGWIGPPAGTYTANDMNLRRVGTDGYFVPVSKFRPLRIFSVGP
ncbi:hypothetical protein IFR04_004361 [Cadophora malorum]|uniref:non-specific serine/threonine protein kinase n=1 Tax=Cadophora malorum TaxID=108018 RepID=A0A8H7WCV2_9HELO|nr:hypothetical protein IFR04_004361 [Cadophora malorum]